MLWEKLREGLASSCEVDTKLMERFVGRTCNLSQFFPELRLPLAVGYAVSRVSDLALWLESRLHPCAYTVRVDAWHRCTRFLLWSPP